MKKKLRFPLDLAPGELATIRRQNSRTGRDRARARHSARLAKRQRARFQRRALARFDDLDPVTVPAKEPAPAMGFRRSHRRLATFMPIGPDSWLVIYVR